MNYEKQYLVERIRVNERLYVRLCQEGFGYSKVTSSVKGRIQRWKQRLKEVEREANNQAPRS